MPIDLVRMQILGLSSWDCPRTLARHKLQDIGWILRQSISSRDSILLAVGRMVSNFSYDFLSVESAHQDSQCDLSHFLSESSSTDLHQLAWKVAKIGQEV